MKIVLNLVVVGVVLLSIGCLANETNFACPVDESDGIYPNCTCRHKNFDYSITLNECFRVCPHSSDGYWPNCKCESGGYFNKKEFVCIACPADSTGQYPNCICNDNDAGFDKLTNNCKKCKGGSDGKFPNCMCPDGAKYERNAGFCVQTNCTSDSYDDGVYPKCVCRDSASIFIVSLNECLSCPLNSTGYYPNCTCLDENLTYSAYINQCYGQCPDNSHGKEPNCQCDDDYYYDADDKACKNSTGRKCPANSIGTGPDCLCMSKYETFDSSSWSCTSEQSVDYFGGSMNCPDDNRKWPQCYSLLDLGCVVRSCSG